MIPHITNEIKRRIQMVPKTTGAEVVLVEVGGTVGDIESLPFMEALRQMRGDVGSVNTLYIHVTWLPIIGATGELKTKPTQHSVRELRSIGISPDMIFARSDHPVNGELIEKIALFCDVEPQAVVPMVTADHLYEIPLIIEELGVADYALGRLGLKARQKPNWNAWKKIVSDTKLEKPKLKVALVGKYVELHDAYMSVREALRHAGLAAGVDEEVIWIHSAELEKGRGMDLVEFADAVLVPGGFGERGTEGKMKAVKYAREKKVPYLGLCLGMQLMVVEFAREVLRDEEVNSTEFDPATRQPVIDLMPDQRTITDMGGTMRLGLYPCQLQPGTRAAAAYGTGLVNERHRHRFEFKNAYREVLQEAGMVFSGISPDGRLIEIAELKDHPFMVATQFHPEFLSRPNRPHPLFVAFLEAAKKEAKIK